MEQLELIILGIVAIGYLVAFMFTDKPSYGIWALIALQALYL